MNIVRCFKAQLAVKLEIVPLYKDSELQSPDHHLALYSIFWTFWLWYFSTHALCSYLTLIYLQVLGYMHMCTTFVTTILYASAAAYISTW